MVEIRSEAPDNRDARESVAAGGRHALRPGAHRRNRGRSLVSVSTALAVVAGTVAFVAVNSHSAVADDATATPAPSASVVLVSSQKVQLPPDLYKHQQSPSPVVATPAAVVKPQSQLPLHKVAKAIAHKESVVRASRAGRRGTKAYNLVYAATYSRLSMGWSDKQVACLSKLWAGESNWRPMARNHHSGAYGIPQALPGRKMRVEGKDWKTNPDTQIRWGVKYIKVKYTTPCRALHYKRSHGWY